jgi:hypothetical protein
MDLVTTWQPIYLMEYMQFRRATHVLLARLLSSASFDATRLCLPCDTAVHGANTLSLASTRAPRSATLAVPPLPWRDLPPSITTQTNLAPPSWCTSCPSRGRNRRTTLMVGSLACSTKKKARRSLFYALTPPLVECAVGSLLREFWIKEINGNEWNGLGHGVRGDMPTKMSMIFKSGSWGSQGVWP